MGLVVLCLIALFVIRLSHWVYVWQNPKFRNGKLPPGSMGFPLVGETIEFITTSNGLSIPPFFHKRIARYGSVFRTNLFGQKIVVLGDSEASYRVFQQEDEYFETAFSESFFPIFEQKSQLISPGMVHKYLKNLALRFSGLENLKKNLLIDMNQFTRTHLTSWADQGNLDVTKAASNMIFEYFAKKLMSYDELKASKKLKENYDAFVSGLISFPINIPGTTYHACLQVRPGECKESDQRYSEEKKASKTLHGDFLDYLLEEVKRKDTILSEELARDFVFAILLATFETTYAAITLAIKFISQHHQVLAELTKEHEAISKNHGCEDSEITWEEYKSMNFTHMVINEIIRIGNIAPGIFRKVVKDVEIKGYTIPAGWIVMINTAVLHLDSKKYDDPLTFNPWRWEGKELNKGSKTFMGFGLGSRLCVGADLAKLQVALFLRHLVLNYRWEVIKGGDIIRKPLLVFPNGLHIKITEKHTR